MGRYSFWIMYSTHANCTKQIKLIDWLIARLRSLSKKTYNFLFQDGGVVRIIEVFSLPTNKESASGFESASDPYFDSGNKVPRLVVLAGCTLTGTVKSSLTTAISKKLEREKNCKAADFLTVFVFSISRSIIILRKTLLSLLFLKFKSSTKAKNFLASSKAKYPLFPSSNLSK